MAVTQTLTIKNPPTSRQFTAWGRIPLPAGTDPRTLGNSLRAVQQGTLDGRSNNWDLYLWHVLAPPGTTSITISDSLDAGPFKQPALATPGSWGGGPPPSASTSLTPVTGPRGGGISTGSGAAGGATPGGTGGTGAGGTAPAILGSSGGRTPELFNERYHKANLDILSAETNFQLVITGHNGVTETINIAGRDGIPHHTGPLRFSWEKHVTTNNFGSFHIIWDLLAFDPIVRLTLNWHVGIPGPEVIFKNVRFVHPNYIKWVPELNDPTMNPATDRMVRGANHLIPRLGQRSFRILTYPASMADPDPNFAQPEGWGVGDWSAGGFLPADLKSHPLDQISGLENHVVNSATYEMNELANLSNRWDNGGVNVTPPSHLWPTWGQQYGGPTGSDGHYKPYNGIRTLAAGRREGLIIHKVLQLRNHCRAWDAVYEPDGTPAVPENHLNTNDEANWDVPVGPAHANMFQYQGGQPAGPYATFKDAGFGFSNFGTRRLPRDYELQSGTISGVGGTQRWSNWDDQHMLLAYQDDIALAWLCGDPLAIKYLIAKAETCRMYGWAGSGTATGRLDEPSASDEGVQWGRGNAWAQYCIANAAVWLPEDDPIEDDVGNPLNPTGRKRTWMDQEGSRFIGSLEKARMPSGACILAGGSGKVFTDPPFSSNYWVHQVFELNYMCHAMAAFYGVFGNAFEDLEAPSTYVDIQLLIREWARAYDNIWWATATPLASAVISAAGTGYSVGDICYLVGSRYYNRNTPPIPTEAAVRVDAETAGVPTAISVNIAGLYYSQPYAPTKTMTICTAPTINAAGSGYQAGQFIWPADGTPAGLPGSGPDTKAYWRIQTVDGSGGITSITQHLAGKYTVPPTNPGPVAGSNGVGALIGFTSSGGAGSGLEITPTWGAPVVHGNQPLKIAPLGAYPGSSRYTTRADFVPLDIMNQTASKSPHYTFSFGQQNVTRASSFAMLGLFGYAAASNNWDLLQRMSGTSTIADAKAWMRGFQLLWDGAVPVENAWPILSFWDT